MVPAARAETQAQLAERSNAKGEAALRNKHYAAASKSFLEAAARVPEPRYFYNLCRSHDGEGKLKEALISCQVALLNSPPAALEAKTKALIEKIRDEAKAKGLELEAVN